jgi:hypothetical protein
MTRVRHVPDTERIETKIAVLLPWNAVHRNTIGTQSAADLRRAAANGRLEDRMRIVL